MSYMSILSVSKKLLSRTKKRKDERKITLRPFALSPFRPFASSPPTLRLIFLCMILAVWLIGCNDINNFSQNPNQLLAFSTDTLSFDTVFTTIGTSTGFFMIYNRNNEALKIETIHLAGHERSGFRINIDGRKGDTFNDIPIWKKDSLYVAVEVTVNPNEENSPFFIYDSVVFITNGRTQYVLLEAYGQNVHILKGGVVFSSDTTLTAERPYLVYDSIRIPEGVTVQIAKGASFYMHKDAKWLIDGTIITSGTQEEPVLFRADRLNKLTPYLSYDNISAQWDGLYFSASSFNNELSYTLIRNGISGLTFEASTPDRKKIDIRNSQINNMDGNVLWAANCHIEASNTEFSNATNYLVMLSGGKYRFTHCTMANYMQRAMMSHKTPRYIQALTLSDHIVYIQENGEEETQTFPLLQAYFDNCIIDGNLEGNIPIVDKGEILFSTDETFVNGDDIQYNYRFNHCVIRAKKVDNERFNEVLFIVEPKTENTKYVKSIPENEDDDFDFIYDFRLANESLGIGKADRSIAAQFPTDRYGINRLTSEFGPSIGAYEYVEE